MRWLEQKDNSALDFERGATDIVLVESVLIDPASNLPLDLKFDRKAMHLSQEMYLSMNTLSRHST